MSMKLSDIKELLWERITKIEVNEDKTEIKFYCNHDIYLMRHDQECSEMVTIEEIIGDLNDLIDTPILYVSEEGKRSSNPPKDPYVGSETWTFYTIRTIKGTVTIRWYGESNGYYSEDARFYEVN